MKIKVKIIEKQGFRSISSLNKGEDMVRVTMDLHKMDWARLKKYLTRSKKDKE